MAGCGGGASSDQKTTTGLAPVPKAAENAAVTQVLADPQSASRAGRAGAVARRSSRRSSPIRSRRQSPAETAPRGSEEALLAQGEIVMQNVTVPNTANATATVKEANGKVSTAFLVKQGGSGAFAASKRPERRSAPRGSTHPPQDRDTTVGPGCGAAPVRSRSAGGAAPRAGEMPSRGRVAVGRREWCRLVTTGRDGAPEVRLIATHAVLP